MSHPTYYSRISDNPSGSTSARLHAQHDSDSHLVPRTPHSRASFQTFRHTSTTMDLSSDDLHDAADDSYVPAQQDQVVPLLSSSASASFPDDAYGQKYQPTQAHRRDRRAWCLREIIGYLPLVAGALFAAMICILLVLSMYWPDVLRGVVSETPKNVNASATSAIHNPTPVPGLTPTNNGTKTHPHTAKIIDYSAYSTFPLTPEEYRAECWKYSVDSHDGGYWYEPPEGTADVAHPSANAGVCSSTITFMFDGDRGLMADLALIAQLAGLAREQNRTFLINDVQWTRGNWTTHFEDIRRTEPGPEPGCLPPSPKELVACPRTAKHWVVTPLTAKFHFGHDFFEEYEDPYGVSTPRLKPIFQRAFDSFESSIILSDTNAQLVRQARSELQKRIQAVAGSTEVTNYMGVHIRHGDRKAMRWEFVKPGADGYVPLANYVEAIPRTWAEQGPPGIPHVYVATDDPVALDDFIAQSSAHVYSLRQWGVDGGRVKEPSVSAVSERLAELASPSAYNQSEWRSRPEDQRIKLTRGMIVEMALISELWDDEREEDNDLELVATVCTLTSNVCKMAAVGLGWPRALEADTKAWVELDNRNEIEPEWEAVETI